VHRGNHGASVHRTHDVGVAGNTPAVCLQNGITDARGHHRGRGHGRCAAVGHRRAGWVPGPAFPRAWATARTWAVWYRFSPCSFVRLGTTLSISTMASARRCGSADEHYFVSGILLDDSTMAELQLSLLFS